MEQLIKRREQLQLIHNLVTEAKAQGTRWFKITFTAKPEEVDDFWRFIIFNYTIPLGVDDLKDGEYLVVW